MGGSCCVFEGDVHILVWGVARCVREPAEDAPQGQLRRRHSDGDSVDFEKRNHKTENRTTRNHGASVCVALRCCSCRFELVFTLNLLMTSSHFDVSGLKGGMGELGALGFDP